jgi:hypothetical protein
MRCKTLLMGSIAMLPAMLASGAHADESNRFMAGGSGTQFMVYVSQPLGNHLRMAPQFGLRFERIQPVAAVSGAPFALQMRHRLLIDLQFARDRAPRIEFGERYRLGYRQGAFAFEDINARPPLR